MTSLRFVMPKNPPPAAPKIWSPFFADGTWIWRGSRIFCRSSSTVLIPYRKRGNITYYSHEVHLILDLLDPVVLLHVPPVLLRLLVEEHQPLPVGGVRVEILLAGQEEIGVAEDIKYF